MQKHIFFTCLLLMISMTAMEKSAKVPLQLTHQSPEITRIHTQKYLQFLTTRADECDSPQYIYSHENRTSNLNDVSTILKATNDVIEIKKNFDLKKPCYSIAMAENSSSWAGNTENSYDQSFYAAIPIAAAHALKTNLFKRILIIDEHLSQNPHAAIERCDVYPHNENAYENARKFIKQLTKDYYESGNGSLLYPDQEKYPELFDLFNDKVITYDRIKNWLWHFLNTDGKDIDLVFYNIDTLGLKEHTDNRNLNIFSLFKNLIPTVFILCKRFANDHLIDYIKTADDIYAVFFSKKISALNSSDTSLSEQSSSHSSSSYNNDDDIEFTDDGFVKIIPYSYSDINDDVPTLIPNSYNNANDSDEISFLSHQSPKITRVHTQKYLEWLEQTHDSEQLKSDLKLVDTILNATNDVIQAQKNENLKPNYSVCVIPDNYYGAGNSKHNYADSYALIPIAAAHALQSNLFKRILILNQLESEIHRSWESDECHNEIGEYYTQGNGSLFELFNDKIITSDKIQGDLYHFLETAGKDIDLIFYNIDMETGGLSEIPRCWILSKKRIPIIFILSGHPGKEKYDPIPAENISKTITTNAGHEPINIHYWYKTEK